MASITIEIWIDTDGNTRVVADDSEAYDNLDDTLAVRKVVLTVDVDEPVEQEISVEVPAEKQGEAKVTVGS